MQPINQTQVMEGPPNHKAYIGFNGRMFPLLAGIISAVSILVSYKIAVDQKHVHPFPNTDITHTGIRYPEYLFLRIGLLVAAPLFTLTFQLLKNYLQIKSFQILGVPEPRLDCFGYLSIISCIALSVSTASISDGNDLNWTIHVAGATSFFIIGLFIALRASFVYRKLWVHQQFCPWWSYQFKKYANFIVAGFIILTIASSLQIIEIGAFVEWAAAFYLIFFAFTLYWDCKDMMIEFTHS